MPSVIRTWNVYIRSFLRHSYGHLNLEGDDMLEKLSASHVLAVDRCDDATMQRAE